MSYHYGANHGEVIPFNEDTAEKMGILEEFKIVRDSEDGLMYLVEAYETPDEQRTEPRHKVDRAVDIIIEVIEKIFIGKWVELYTELGDIVEPGGIVKEGVYFFFLDLEDLYDMTPNKLLLSLREKGLEPVTDYWVTGG
jgi:hypothetical protein